MLLRACVVLVLVGGCGSDREATAAKPRDEMKQAMDATLDPIIGTRAEEDGPLTPTFEIDEAFTGYVACDLRYDNIPNGTEIELVWLFKPAPITEQARIIHRAWYRIHDGDRGPKRAWVDRIVDPSTHKNVLGAYECLWTFGSRGTSRRLVVRGT